MFYKPQDQKAEMTLLLRLNGADFTVLLGKPEIFITLGTAFSVPYFCATAYRKRARDLFVRKMYASVKAYKTKLNLFSRQVSKNFPYFPSLATMV